MLEWFRTIVKQFPTSEHAARARKRPNMLAQIIQEDEVHSRQGLRPLDKLPIKERVAELIFQLRDQNGEQICQPDRATSSATGAAKRQPRHQLVALGFDAVPQLIDAIDDRRLTRAVGFHRSFYFSHYILRVGDCAADILDRIASHSFNNRFNATLLIDGKEAEVKKRVPRMVGTRPG